MEKYLYNADQVHVMVTEQEAPGSWIREIFRPVIVIQVVLACGMLYVLYLVSLWNYLVFHSIIEIAGIAVALTIFLILWNLRRMVPDTFFLIVGISFLFIGGIDLVHTLAYKGMGVFPGDNSDLPTQLWIAGRYFQSITFLIAAIFIGKSITRDRKYDAAIIFAACAAACVLLLSSIFVWHNFPSCFIEGSGLTPFKIISEYIISLILVVAIGVLFIKRKSFDPRIFRPVVAAVVFLILGELAFTSYVSVYGFMNMLGHIFRLVSVYFFYRAFVDLSISRVYDSIVRELHNEREFSHLLLDASPAFYVAIGNDGRTIMMNRALLDALEYTDEEVKGKDYLATFVPAEEHEYLSQVFQEIIQGRTTVNVNRIISKSKKTYLVEWHGNPVRQEAGKAGFFVRVGIDITERRRAEETIRESGKRLQEAQEMAHLGFWSWDIGTGRVEWSDEVFRIFGLDPGEFTPHIDSILALSPWPEEQQRGQELIRRAMASREPGVYEQRFLRPDNTTGYYFSTFQGHYNDRGNLVTIVGTVLDITDRKRAEEALRESEERILLLLNSTAEAIYGLDRDGNCTFCNNACLRVLGYSSQEELLGKNMHWLIHAKHADGSPYPVDKCRIFQAFRKGEGTHVDDEVLWRADGTSFPAEYWSYPQRVKGDVIGAVVTFLDISDRKQAQEALVESEERFRLFIMHSPAALAMFDRDMRYLAVSPRWISDYQLAGRDIIGQSHYSVFPEIPGSLKEVHRRGLAGEVVSSSEDKLVRQDGSVQWLAWEMRPWYTEGHQVGGIIIFSENITERKQAELQREMLIRELENKNAELERFTYTVSHDLKSPLITIRGFAGLLEADAKKGDTVQFQKDVERIMHASDTMLQILSDVLELSRIGRIVSPPEKTSFGGIAKEAVELLDGPLAERNVSIEIAPDLPYVNVDPARIRQVMVNLIENAIKYAGNRPDPVIRIGVDRSGKVPVFFVQDNGIGIDTRYLDRIFNLFEKLDPSFPGTGVGLTIVKRIIEVHGGKIWAESKGPGKGSTFRFTLPVTEGKPEKND